MQNWKNLTANLPSVSMPQVGGFEKGFKQAMQATRERLGQVDPSEVTELPAEYKALEARVDALYNVHKSLVRIGKVYETESVRGRADSKATVSRDILMPECFLF